jgi:microcystin-dependent protein
MAAPTGRTSKQNLPYPIPDDNVDVPRDIKALADAVDPLGYVPPGAIMMWLAGAAPPGWYLMKGQTTVPAAGNPTLVAQFGQTGGFVNMPDFQGLMPVGTSTDFPTLGGKGGAKRVKLTALESGTRAHGHTAASSNSGSLDHAHVPGTGYGYVYAGGPPQNAAGGAAGSGSNFSVDASNTGLADRSLAHNHPVTVNNATAADAQNDHENMPPYVVLNYIVRGG